MIETIKETLIVLGRIVTILPLLLFITIYMGKRAIGELPVFDFLIILVLGSVVGADIADPEVQHLQTGIAIIAIGILQKVVSKLKIANRFIGRLLTFEPTVVIQNGKLLRRNIKKINYSVDNVLQMLREKDVFSIDDIETAIIESSGALSVYKRAQKQTATAGDLGILHSSPGISVPVIMEGTVYPNVLQQYDLDDQWLKQELLRKGIHDTNEIFYASINKNLELHISLKNENPRNLPYLYH
ncbi:DUF421 domain-containing protein [Rossellomorea vietnamensis]|uniref:DUF421 domain-containing protein n=1 Tax=Rossellomorea vietnamensis TaxID=218284 RepID=A0A5D4MEE7_9BACI|nr:MULTISPECIES: DUF421 domain-containing protein [Bacillaceae]TYR99858.1 DUF421 domain-containing protein [Rossellomorea vietnamensis]